MSQNTKIEWTDGTWNPVRGCTKVSAGCLHCYAFTFAERFRGVADHPYEQGFDLRLVPEKLLEPLTWSTPRTIFVNSMSDLFQPSVPDDYILAIAKVMESSPWHTYQVLTKRSARMRDMLNNQLSHLSFLSHIWWGVSVENKSQGLIRLEDLRKTKSRIRFLSIEPLLEDLGQIDLLGIDWVIVGGESGPGARPIELEWVQSILKQCEEQNINFFFKQWGGVRKSKTGRILNDRTYDEIPLRTPVAIPNRLTRAAIADDLKKEISSFTEVVS